MLSVKVTTRI